MLNIIEKIEEYQDSEAVDYLESALEDLKKEEKERGLTVHCLTQAQLSLEVARSNLLSALSHSPPVEAVLIQQMLGRLSVTDLLVNQTKSAMEANPWT